MKYKGTTVMIEAPILETDSFGSLSSNKIRPRDCMIYAEAKTRDLLRELSKHEQRSMAVILSRLVMKEAKRQKIRNESQE